MPPADAQLLLLGPPQFSSDGQVVDLPSGQVSLLAAILGLTGHPIERERVASLLWPDAERRTALHSLSQALYRLRKVVGPSHLQTFDHTLELRGTEVDLDLLREGIRDQNVRVSRLVRGPFLAGSPACSLELDHWLDGYRTEYQLLLKELLEFVVLAGIRSEILRIARISGHEDVVLAVDAEPSLQGDGGGGRSGPSSKFVGRVGQLNTLRHVWTQSTESRTARSCLLYGPPGIGKTSLGERFSRYVAIKGGTVLSARCVSFEQRLPWGVLGQLLDDVAIRTHFPELEQPWRTIVEHIFGGIVPSGGLGIDDHRPADISGEIQIHEAVYRLVRLVSPLLLFVDDVEWCDPASLSFLHYLYRRGEHSPLVILFTSRSTRPLEGIGDFENLNRVRVPELTDTEAQEFLSGSSLSERSSELLSRSGGNPLLLRILAENPDAPTAVLAGHSPAADVLRPRLSKLTPVARHLLAVLSVLGGVAEANDLLVVGETSTPEGLAAVGELAREGLVSEEGALVRSTHGLAGEVLLSDLSGSAYRVMNAKVARHLRNDGTTPAAVLAVQYDVAGDSNAFELAVEAADVSLKLHAYREAQFFLKLAVTNAPTKGQSLEVRVKLARLLLKLGKPSEAYTILDVDPDGGSPTTRLWIDALRLGARLEHGVEPGEGKFDVAWGLVEKARDENALEVIAYLLSQIGIVAYDLGLRDAVVTASRELLQISVPDGGALEISNQIRKAAALLTVADSADNALALLNAPPSQSGSIEHEIDLHLSRGFVRVAQGALKEAETHLLQALSLVEEYGIYASRIQAYNNLGVCYTEWGRYTEAEGALRTALDFSVQSEFGLKDKMVSLDNLAILSYEQRKFEDSLNYARMSLEANAPLESRRAWLCSLGIAGLCSLHLGRLADAREYEREISIGPKLEEYWLSDISYAEIFLARMQHHRGRTPAAVARLEWCAEAFEGRDFFCSNRMKVERLRLSLDRNRDVALRDIRNLLPELRAALAGTLASRLEEVLNRVHP